jgi:hypothetical protein
MQLLVRSEQDKLMSSSQHTAPVFAKKSRRASMGRVSLDTHMAASSEHAPVFTKKSRRASMGRVSLDTHMSSSQHTAPVVAKKSRRSSMGRVDTFRRLMKTNSVSELFGKEDSVMCGYDSTSTFDMTDCPDTSVEMEATALLVEVNCALVHQSDRKVKLQSNMDLDQELAMARFSSGCPPLGPILSMRKAHKNKVKLAYLAGASFELITIRKLLENYLKNRNQNENKAAGMDMELHRQKMETTLHKLATFRVPTPTDEVLLKQLEQLLDLRGRASI